MSLSGQGKHAEAELIHREVLGARTRVLGEERPDTLASANNLASSLFRQGKHAEAGRIHREMFGVQRRVLGEERPETLTSADNLALSLFHQGKHAEAEDMLQAALAARQRMTHDDARERPPLHAYLAEVLENMRSKMSATQPTKKGAKAAARKQRAAASPLSSTALAKAEARTGSAETELLAMLELEEARG
jgi:hypothetical protein